MGRILDHISSLSNRISSIKLDKMKKRQIRKFLGAWTLGIHKLVALMFIVYLLTVFISAMFPLALDIHAFEEPIV